MVDLYQHSLDVICAGQSVSGAYVASPTFSQYGYSWLRDGAWIAYAMSLAGRPDSAERFHRWVASTIERYALNVDALIVKQQTGQPLSERDFLPTRFTVDGTLGTDDWPDFQLDGYGAWLWTLAQFCQTTDHPLWSHVVPAVCILGRYLEALWQHPNYDCWEEHRQQVHTATLAALYGGVSAIAALDKSLMRSGLAADIRSFILSQCVSQEGHFVKFLGNDNVDASLLWIAVPFGVVAVTDPVFQATLAKIEHDLIASDGGVYRYRADTYFGGGEWLLLTAWLGWVYHKSGREEDARRCLRWVERQAASNGDMPEQVAHHLLDASYFDGWVAKWGTSALPLLWSHAMYLILHHELKERA